MFYIVVQKNGVWKVQTQNRQSLPGEPLCFKTKAAAQKWCNQQN